MSDMDERSRHMDAGPALAPLPNRLIHVSASPGFPSRSKFRIALPMDLDEPIRQLAERLGGTRATVLVTATAIIIPGFIDQSEPVFIFEVLDRDLLTVQVSKPLLSEGTFEHFHRQVARELFIAQDAAREANPASGARTLVVPGDRLTIFYHDDTNHGHVTDDSDRYVGFLYLDSQAAGDYADSLAAAFRVLLCAAIKSPTLPARTLPLIDRQQHEKIIETFNQVAAPYPHHKCLHQLFEDRVRLCPHAIALVEDEREVSFDELNNLANRLAHHLRMMGLACGSPVGLVASRSVNMIVSILAILKAGGAYVPLDPTYPKDRICYILDDTGIKIVLAEARHLVGYARDAVEMVCIETALAADPSSISNPGNRSSPSDLAYIMYTSGSTGSPKGVMTPHLAVVRLACDRSELDIRQEDIVLHMSSCSFDASTFEIWPSLINGARLILSPDANVDPVALGNLLHTQEVTVLWLTAGLFRVLVESSDVSFRNVQKLFVGGDVVPVTAVARFLSSFPQCRLINGYGPTEGTVFSACGKITTPLGNRIPIGRPVSNTRLYLLNNELAPVPIGAVGEIYIAGDGLARGYLNRPALTASRFIADPFGIAGRLYRTGDLGKWHHSGEMEFLGRSDAQVKIRGYRIEPGEIEAVLMTKPGVRAAVVLPESQEDGDKRLVAYFSVSAPKDTYSVNAAALRHHLETRLPGHMIPAAFVQVADWPLTSNGKLDRIRLPSADRSAYCGSESELPSGAVEEAVAGAWSRSLGGRDIRRGDNFFSLGGDSLTAAKVTSALSRQFNLHLAATTLFASPILADFAGRLRDAPPRAEFDAPAAGQEVSSSQSRLWFLSQDPAQSIAYHVPMAMMLQGNLDAPALASAFRHLVTHHDELRANFYTSNGRLLKRIRPPSDAPALRQIDFKDIHEPGALDRLLTQAAAHSFDLEHGWAIRALLVTLNSSTHILLLTAHHVVVDGIAMSLLSRDISKLYNHALYGEPLLLKTQVHRFSDHVVRQRRRLTPGTTANLDRYWRETLAGIPQLLKLPTDRPRPQFQDFAGGQVQLDLDPSLAARLVTLTASAGLTLFVPLLAAWSILLSREANETDLVIGVPFANREDDDDDDLVGYLANTHALRIDLSGTPSIQDLFHRIRSRLHGALAHQDLPFERVVDLIKLERNPSYSPVFQVMFAWHSYPMPELDLRGVVSGSYRCHAGAAKFDLSLSLYKYKNTIRAELDYATALFENQTMNKMLDCYNMLLNAIAADPDALVSTLSFRSISNDAMAEHQSAPTDRPAIMAGARSVTTDKLVTIWSLVLKRRNIDVRENFFDLGGDSFLLIRLQHEIQLVFGIKIPIPDLLVHPTINAVERLLVQDADQSDLTRQRRRRRNVQQPRY